LMVVTVLPNQKVDVASWTCHLFNHHPSTSISNFYSLLAIMIFVIVTSQDLALTFLITISRLLYTQLRVK